MGLQWDKRKQMNFSDEQIKIIEAPVDEKSIVIAAA